MERFALPLLLMIEAWPAWAQEPPAAAVAFAAAIRSYFDEGPTEALAQLEALVAPRSNPGDVAWWRARCLLDLQRPEAALDALGGAGVGNIPGWRFDALRAQAEVLVGQAPRALEAGARALETSGEGTSDEDLLHQTRLLVAALSARAGQDARALEALAELPSPPPALDLPSPLFLALPEAGELLAAPLAPGARLPGALGFQAAGAWWRVEAGAGLARRSDPPQGPVRECAGPDLCAPDGALVLPAPGVRYSPRVHGGVLYYGAGREPLALDDGAPGLFSWDGGDAAPRRLTRAPEGAFDLDPGLGQGGEVLFLRRVDGHTRLLRREEPGQAVELAPDLTTVGGLTVVGDVAVLAAVQEGRAALRWVPVEADPSMESQPLLVLPLDQWTPRLLSPPGGATGRW